MSGADCIVVDDDDMEQAASSPHDDTSGIFEGNVESYAVTDDAVGAVEHGGRIHVVAPPRRENVMSEVDMFAFVPTRRASPDGATGFGGGPVVPVSTAIPVATTSSLAVLPSREAYAPVAGSGMRMPLSMPLADSEAVAVLAEPPRPPPVLAGVVEGFFPQASRPPVSAAIMNEWSEVRAAETTATVQEWREGRVDPRGAGGRSGAWDIGRAAVASGDSDSGDEDLGAPMPSAPGGTSGWSGQDLSMSSSWQIVDVTSSMSSGRGRDRFSCIDASGKRIEVSLVQPVDEEEDGGAALGAGTPTALYRSVSSSPVPEQSAEWLDGAPARIVKSHFAPKRGSNDTEAMLRLAEREFYDAARRMPGTVASTVAHVVAPTAAARDGHDADDGAGASFLPRGVATMRVSVEDVALGVRLFAGHDWHRPGDTGPSERRAALLAAALSGSGARPRRVPAARDAARMLEVTASNIGMRVETYAPPRNPVEGPPLSMYHYSALTVAVGEFAVFDWIETSEVRKMIGCVGGGARA